MITFGHMPPLAVTRLPRIRSTLAAIALSTFVLALSGGAALGQTALSHTDDATPVPSGSVRVTITN